MDVIACVHNWGFCCVAGPISDGARVLESVSWGFEDLGKGDNLGA